MPENDVEKVNHWISLRPLRTYLAKVPVLDHAFSQDRRRGRIVGVELESTGHLFEALCVELGCKGNPADGVCGGRCCELCGF